MFLTPLHTHYTTASRGLHGFIAIFNIMTLRNVIRSMLKEAEAPERTGVAPRGGFERTGVAPPGADATAPIPALQARRGPLSARVAANLPDPTAVYRDQVDRVAQKVGKALGMMEIRYLARSKRVYGAYAYKAISPNYMNVIVKISPEHELAGYQKIEEIKQSLPADVAKHFPRIYKITNLKKLGIEWPKADPSDDDRNLGVIVMEALEELPGPVFDLIKQPPAADDFVLEVFLNDTVLLNDFIEKYLITQQVHNVIESFLDDAKPDYTVADIEDVKTAIKDRLMLLRNFKYPRFEPSILNRVDFRKPTQRIAALKPQIKRLVHQALGRFNPGIEMIDDTVTTLANEFSDEIVNQDRAIPTEPSMGGRYGVMSGTNMLTSFKRAVKYMTNHGIFVSDLHANNLMLRPESMDIVIADLGHFEQENNLPPAPSF